MSSSHENTSRDKKFLGLTTYLLLEGGRVSICWLSMTHPKLCPSHDDLWHRINYAGKTIYLAKTCLKIHWCLNPQQYLCSGTNYSAEVTDNVAGKKVLKAECFHPIIWRQKNWAEMTRLTSLHKTQANPLAVVQPLQKWQSVIRLCGT